MIWNILWHQAMTHAVFKGILVKKEQTVEFQVPVNQDASAMRLHLVNRFSRKAAPVEVAIEYAGQFYSLQKNGTTKMLIPAGDEIYTDELAILLKTGTDLKVRIYYGAKYLDCNAIEEDAQMYKGNTLYLTDPQPIPFSEFELNMAVFRNVPYVDRVEIGCEQSSKNIVAFGDSITTMSRWTKPLAERLYKSYGGEYTLLNSGISGNCLTYETSGIFKSVFGEMGIRRYEQDVLALGNVSTVIMSFGINDISYMKPKKQKVVNIERLINETKRMCELFHTKNIRVVIQTLGPRKGYQKFTPEMEQMRQKYNAWVRSDGIFDYVVDPEPQLLQEGTTDTYKDGLHQGDYLHPSKQGGMIIANAFELTKLVGKA